MNALADRQRFMACWRTGGKLAGAFGSTFAGPLRDLAQIVLISTGSVGSLVAHSQNPAHPRQTSGHGHFAQLMLSPSLTRRLDQG